MQPGSRFLDESYFCLLIEDRVAVPNHLHGREERYGEGCVTIGILGVLSSVPCFACVLMGVSA